MPGTIHAGGDRDVFNRRSNFSERHVLNNRWNRLAASAIVILGSPRSGTSWLAKIFDSHPDVLYRHEPDELAPARPELDSAAQIAAWIRQRGLRAAVKRPNFPKSWRPAALDQARMMLAAVLAVAQRLPVLSGSTGRVGVPDLVMPGRRGTVRAAVKLVNWNGNGVARSMPQTRCIFIMRHPCGQVASLLAGRATSKFAASGDLPGLSTEVAAVERAGRAGIDAAAFRLLPVAAKLAWCWVAFNEPVVCALHELPNARIVIYEELCRRPEALSQELLAFAGLDWHPQTAAFLDSSTRDDRASGYFDVFRATNQVADRWRLTMNRQDQEAVCDVIQMSNLRRCWPDLATAAA